MIINVAAIIYEKPIVSQGFFFFGMYIFICVFVYFKLRMAK